MRRCIVRRGPDAEGAEYLLTNGYSVTLMHSRLSILDLTARASQPMHHPESGWVITYNGEIFNFVELRNELESLGDAFVSRSDTEVLLKAWARWGLGALPRLNGMFAFAAFNVRTGELWLVRDRFGVKPLVWSRIGDGGLAFSSSVAAVAQLAGAAVDAEYCARGLRYKVFESDAVDTPFGGVHAVAAGGWVRVALQPSGLVVGDGRWYDLAGEVAARCAELASLSDAKLLESCRETLESAVRLRLRSDVSVAVSLSGGLDSSTVAALASRDVPALRGFSYGSPMAHRSEGPTVAEFGRGAAIDVKFVWPEHSALELDALLERTLVAQEAPFPGMSVMAQGEVFRAVREAGFKVLLGGQGGDECFAGYRKFFLVALRSALTSRDANGILHFMWSLGLMLLHEAGQARLYWQGLSRYRRKREFRFAMLDWQAPDVSLWGSAGGSLRDRQIEDILRWSIPTLLRYEDRNSMGHGVESRLPFMDYRLLELALALPDRLKIAKGFGKWALRMAGRGVVPDFIRLNRKKRGFDVTQDWIRQGVGAGLRARIDGSRSQLAPYLRHGVDLETLLQDERLASNRNLFDEALMLAWLTQPIRLPAARPLEAAA